MELNQLILANTCAEVVTGADVAWYSSSHFLLKYVSFSQVTVRRAKPVFALKKKAFENSAEQVIPAKYHALES